MIAASTTAWFVENSAGRARWLEAAGRGAPVVAGPLLAWPASTSAALATVGLGRVPGSTATVLAGVTLLAVSVATALRAARGGRPAVAVETGLLVLLFVALPPLAAFGVYFGAWHGLRHTARLLADDPRNATDLARRRLLRPLGRFLRAAATPTLVALAATVGLVALAAGHAGLDAPVFQLLLALTVPHVVVVALWDRALVQHPHNRPLA